MTSKQIFKGFVIGLISGTLLGLFLRGMQTLTGIKVYVLLLNVDFIPMFTSKSLPEWLEFSFHLAISCVIGTIFVYILEKQNVTKKGSWILSLILSFPTLFLYFPLSYLAVKDVPGLFDSTAILIWAVGHILYALSLPALYIPLVKAK
ncbi:hypothetical protein JI667_05540 [Bacillus sp. NTK074B]|nr:hypothetical protein [Bacillus sp. NTK074B]